MLISGNVVVWVRRHEATSSRRAATVLATGHRRCRCRRVAAAASRPCSRVAGDGERARRPAAGGGSCTSTTSGDGTFRALASTGASFTHTILLLLRS